MQVKRPVIDITPAVNGRLAVFPGDRAYKRHVSMDFPKDHLALSWIEATVHLGAHADASCHYHPDGRGIDERDLEDYLGPATVVEVDLPKGTRIGPSQVPEAVRPRVLFKTKSFDPYRWSDDFNALSPELLDRLAEKRVRLVGIDTPSVDPAEDRELLSHRAVYRHKMAVLEGLVLDEVNPGDYVLCALPLKLEGADAAPVRAVLWGL